MKLEHPLQCITLAIFTLFASAFGYAVNFSTKPAASSATPLTTNTTTNSHAPSPQRIASLNLCTDQVLLMLVPKQRIVSVTYLASQADYSYTWEQAQGLHTNSGLAEQVMEQNPDLILASPYTPGSAVNLLKQMHYPIEVVTIPQTLAEVENFVRHLGTLVNETQLADNIVKTMQDKIAAVQLAPNTQRKTALIYAPNGHTAGKKTLKHEILTKAGYRNLAAGLGIEYYGNLSIEQLLHAKPDLVIIDDSTSNQNSLAQRFTKHPALTKALSGSQIMQIDTNQWLCAGPMAAEAIAKLAAHRDQQQ